MNKNLPRASALLAGAALAWGLSPAWAQSAQSQDAPLYPSPSATTPAQQTMPAPADSTISSPTQDAPADTMAPLPSEPTSAGYGSSGTGDSWVPYTSSGYIGVQGGSATLDTPCLVNCDDPGWAGKVSTGGMFNKWLGIELAYLQLGDADRNNGTVEVKGVNLSLVGNLPVGSDFNLHAKVGSTYSWTDTSVGVGVPAADGEENGFGLSYGAGASYDFNRNWSLTLDWERHHAKFAGDNDKDYDLTLLGVKYRF